MRTTVKVDTRALTGALKAYSKEARKKLPDVILEEGVFLMKEGMEITPPTGKGNFKGKSVAAKKQGENAITRSMYNSFSPLQSRLMRDPDIKKAIRKQDVETIDRWLKNIGSRKTVVNFSSSQHEANRNKQGRVKFSTNKVIIDKDSKNFKQEIKNRKQNVGFFKSAWGSGAITLASARSKNATGIPAWIKRHTATSGKLLRNVRIRKEGNKAGFDITVMSLEMIRTFYPKTVNYRKSIILKKQQAVLDRAAKRAEARRMALASQN